MSVEQLKTKSTSQLAELGKKGDAVNRLKAELGEKTATKTVDMSDFTVGTGWSEDLSRLFNAR